MAFEIGAVIEEATSKETFDVFAFVKNTNTPEDEVVVYTDADAALKLAKILVAEKEREERDKREGGSLTDEYEVADEDEITELHERLVASSLIFTLKGLAPSAQEALEKHLKATLPFKQGAENPEFNEALNNALIAKSIRSVRNVEGAVNEESWTPEQVSAFTSDLYPSEANKLFAGVAEVNYVGAIFDRAVSADFS